MKSVMTLICSILILLSFNDSNAASKKGKAKIVKGQKVTKVSKKPKYSKKAFKKKKKQSYSDSAEEDTL